MASPITSVRMTRILKPTLPINTAIVLPDNSIPNSKLQDNSVTGPKIALGAVDNTRLGNMAQATFKGRAAGSGTGSPADLTAAQATAIINAFAGDTGAGGTKGAVPAPAAGDATAQRYLRADGTWVAPFIPTLGTRAALIAATIPAFIAAASVIGYTTAIDGQGGQYVRISTPAPVKAWHAQSADGAWWELRTDVIKPRMLGAAGDAVADDATAVQAAHDYAFAFRAEVDTDALTYAIPTATLTLDNGVIVRGGGTYRRTTGTAAVLLSATGKTAPQVRDITLDTNVWNLSTTSNSVAVGTKVWTVPAGIGYNPGDAIIAVANDAKNYMVGTVSTYVGTTLTLTVTVAQGSGTFTNWTILRNDGNHQALRFTGCANAVCERVTFTGRWYSTVESRNGTADKIAGCSFSTVINRPIFIQATGGNSVDVEVSGNRIDGGSLSQYGINALGAPGFSITGLNTLNNKIFSTIFQGIEYGGNCLGGLIDGNKIRGVLDVAGIGILIQESNSQQPSDNKVLGNYVSQAGTGYYVRDGFYNLLNDNQAVACTNGIVIAQSGATLACQYNEANRNKIRAFTGIGINISAFTGGGMAGTRTDGNDIIGTGGATTGILWNALAAPSVVAIGNSALSCTTAYTKGAALRVDQFNV
jgi:hypothetical protein